MSLLFLKKDFGNIFSVKCVRYKWCVCFQIFLLLHIPSTIPSVLHVCKPKVIFLLTKGGVKQDDIGKVIALDPQLLGCSIAHKLEVSVKYFRSLGIYHFVLGQMVADFPALLRYNVDIL